MRLAEEKSKQKFAGGDDFTSVRKIWLRIFLVFSHYGTGLYSANRNRASYVLRNRARALAGSPIKNFGAKWMIFLAPSLRKTQEAMQEALRAARLSNTETNRLVGTRKEPHFQKECCT